MSLLLRFFRAIDKISPAKVAHAHCDIPCGIYDPHLAQLAAHTVIRMVNMISELTKIGSQSTPKEREEYIHKLTRYTATKEEHAELCKHEIRIIWGDYFKQEHTEKYPELHDLVFKIMKLASKARQEVNLQASKELLEAVQEFAEIFWETKGVKTAKVAAPYPSGGEIVVARLY